MSRLWFVTPVHGRYERTRLCLEQRVRMQDELAGLGVTAQTVVVGDDDNLATARELGLTILERENVLGFKVNEGVEWACREGGADHVVYAGSDDWMLAAFYVDPPDGQVRTSRLQGFVTPRGDRLVVLTATAPVGGAPWLIPRALLEACRFRPSRDASTNGIDSTIADSVFKSFETDVAMTRYNRAMRRRKTLAAAFVFDDGHPLRLVDFKGHEQVTAWSRIAPKARERVVLDSPRPFETLAEHYPADLVERMERLYAEGTPR